MPERFCIVGCSRTPLSSDTFKTSLFERYQTSDMDLNRWDEFSSLLHYVPITYDQASFDNLSKALLQIGEKHQTQGNRIFDLAVPPQLYPVIGKLLGEVGLAKEQSDTFPGWARIIVEKPFGHNLETARALNDTLQSYFSEKQIFRIDHYLAKETIQNVLIFRFANTIFEPLWNRHHIDYIGIIAAEQLGVGSRAGYYEKSGVIRDMFQNHMMQLLALTAMEPPYQFTANAVRDEKVKVMKSLREFNRQKGSRICLGQYSSGSIAGESVPGYRDEQGVDPQSLTPTFALMELYLDNWRWQNVPFYMVSGKRLPRKETKIIIQFKEVPHKLFQSVFGDNIGANRLVIETYPEESIKLSFQTKSPGTSVCLRTMNMDFVYQEHYRGFSLDAYARVLLDCISGDHMLFWRQDGVEQSWSFLTPVLEDCETCYKKDELLNFYPAGSWGPQDAHDTMTKLFPD